MLNYGLPKGTSLRKTASFDVFWKPPPQKKRKNSRDNLPKSQITGLQKIQKSLARAVVKAPKSNYITPIFRSLHWLKITERIECKLLSLTYKVLTTTQPSYLHNLITLQPPRSTRSSSLVKLARPSTSSSLRITDRSFQYASPRL